MLRPNFLVVVLTVFAGFCLPTYGAENAIPPVSVQSTSGHVTVKIIETTNLSVVLDAVCKQARFDCQLSGIPASAKIAPATLTGTWDDVVAQLLEGSDLNYAVLLPSPNSSGGILVSARPTGVNPPQVTQAPTAMPAMTDTSANQSNANQGSTEQPQQSSSALGPPSPEPDSAAALAPPSGYDFAPFPDASGRPMAVPSPTGASPQFAPFPDPSGRPIPVTVTNEHPTYLPFPDPQGNPIPAPPINNEPPPYIPWTDPQGRPIPTPPQVRR